MSVEQKLATAFDNNGRVRGGLVIAVQAGNRPGVNVQFGWDREGVPAAQIQCAMGYHDWAVEGVVETIGVEIVCAPGGYELAVAADKVTKIHRPAVGRVREQRETIEVDRAL